MRSYYFTFQWKKLLFPGLLAFAILLIARCSSDDSYTPPAPVMQVKLANSASLGDFLVDKDGRTLYFFANDSATVNTCQSAGCKALWPIFFAGITPQTIGKGLDINDFDTIGAGASMQLAYKGRPLYYYAPSSNGTNKPEAAGQTLGEGVGNNWFVAKPDYTITVTNAQLVGADGNKYDSALTLITNNSKTRYLTDARGNTLYAFTVDKLNTSNCTSAGCLGTWPVYVMDKIVVPSYLNKADFTVITHPSGSKQLAYKGWPLYYYVGDNMTMGLNKGVSVSYPRWPVVVRSRTAAPAP
ncbi:COG4315 family predicted lipoprotein [Niabella hirudinis]|uniref:COG4315 family predicted lipoprotein n=1 Tax=Niabella hirudinis TaxID=1285929 RepID=UPI003EBB983F